MVSITEDSFKKYTVQELRKYISKNKIFRGGLSTLSKSDLIKKILDSEFIKNIENIDIGQSKDSIIKELTTKLNVCIDDKKTKRKPRKTTSISKPKIDEKDQKDQKDEIKKDIKTEILDILDVKDEKDEKYQKDEKDEKYQKDVKDEKDQKYGYDDKDKTDLHQYITDIFKNYKSEIEDIIKTNIHEALDKYNIPPKDDGKRVEYVERVIREPNTSGLYTYTDSEKKQIHIPHTLINIYSGGSSNPNFPIPQSVVRNAINSTNLAPTEYNNVASKLVDIGQSAPQFEGIPPQVIPTPVPHPSQSQPEVQQRFGPPPPAPPPAPPPPQVIPTPPPQVVAQPKPKPKPRQLTPEEEKRRAENPINFELAEIRKAKAGSNIDELRNKLNSVFAERGDVGVLDDIRRKVREAKAAAEVAAVKEETRRRTEAIKREATLAAEKAEADRRKEELIRAAEEEGKEDVAAAEALLADISEEKKE